MDFSETPAIAQTLHLSDDLIRTLIRTIAQIENSQRISRIATFLDALLFGDTSESVSDEDLPVPEPSMEEALRYLWLPVLLRHVPRVRKKLSEQGVDKRDTLLLFQDIERWTIDFQRRHNVGGLGEVAWLRLHFTNRLFQFGRLQYEPRKLEWPYRIYQHRSSGVPLAFLDNDAVFRTDGQFSESDRNSIFPPSFSASKVSKEYIRAYVCNNPEFFEGYPVHPIRGISDRTVTIHKKSWIEVSLPGSRIIAVHIPASGPLLPEEIETSLYLARCFFSQDEPTLFTCDSWLMDPTLRLYLSYTSNIIQFQNRFTIIPVPDASDRQHFERVFPKIPQIPEMLLSAQPENSLQHSLLTHIRNGGYWRRAAGIIPSIPLTP